MIKNNNTKLQHFPCWKTLIISVMGTSASRYVPQMERPMTRGGSMRWLITDISRNIKRWLASWAAGMCSRTHLANRPLERPLSLDRAPSSHIDRALLLWPHCGYYDIECNAAAAVALLDLGAEFAMDTTAWMVSYALAILHLSGVSTFTPFMCHIVAFSSWPVISTPDWITKQLGFRILITLTFGLFYLSEVR